MPPCVQSGEWRPDPIWLPIWLAVLLGALALWAFVGHLVVPGARWVLRRRINRVLEAMGRPPLPFVEALYDFEPAEPVFAEQPPRPLPTPSPEADPETDEDLRHRKRRLIFALVAAMVFLEIVLPLLILFVL